MTDDGEDRGALAGDGGKHSDKVKLALVNHVPNNPLVKAVHGLRNQMSLPPLDDDGEDESTPGKHERKELRSRSSNGESTGSSGVSPTGTDISSGTDSSPREEYARPSPVMKGASQSKRSDDTGESVTETSDVLDVLCEMAKERSAAMASSEGGLKGPCDAALRSSNKRSLEDGSMEDPPDAEEKGENERRLSFDSLSSYGGAGAVAKAAVGVGGDAATDASTSASSSMVTLEELSEEVLERDAKCAADASLQDAPLPKPHLRPPLPTRLTDTSNLDASQAEKQPMHMKSETDSDATPQGTTKISASEVRISEQQRKGISPLMIQQSSDNDDVGEAKDDGFEEEPISPTLRKIGKKIGRAGQKLGGGLAALRQRGPPVSRKSSDSSHPTLTLEDIEICQRLDEEYERALEEREVGWTARYNSVRQSACLSLTFMVLYLILGTLFFRKHTSWDIPDSLLFTIYTITTVGYGNHYLPTNPGFQLFVIFYIFVGIATLTILVAQVYQCIALEATRAQFSRDKADLIRRNNERAEVAGRQEDGRFTVGSRGGSGSSLEFSQRAVYNTSCSEQSFHAIVHAAEVTKHFLRYTRAGRGIAFILPFVGLILIGALVVGSIEGWTFVESIYFAVVSLTTVGFGDYYPTEKSSIYFCIFWLPFSVGFMSLYLGSVAHFYISLSNSNIQRMERRMRRRIKRAKEAAEKERQEAYARAMAAAHLNVESGGEDEESPQDISSSSVHRGRKRRSRGFATVPDSDAADEDDSTASSHDSLFGSPGQGGNYGTRRRRRILENASMRGYSSANLKQSAGQTMTTMKDVLKTVKAHIRRKASRSNRDSFSSVFVGNDPMGPEFEFMSARSNNHSHRIGLNHHETHRRKPSFALRALVQERVAEIISCDIAGYQSHVEIKENTLRITIDTLKSTTEKWMIPRRARKAFRAVAFEVLYFVGEHGLITRGADALYDLTPFEFHGLFGPFLAAMGDADTMESWLRNTDVLADVELKRDPTRPSLASSGKRGPVRHMPSSESGGDDDDRSGTKWLSAKQTRKLDSVKERHLENASKITSQPPLRNSQGNAVSNATR